MKKQLIYILVLTCIWALWAGCGIQTSSETGEPKVITLSCEELAFFNGNSFFNRDSFDIRNQFLSSLYDTPEEIDLYALFYNGINVTDRAEGDELADFLKANGMSCSIDEVPCPCTKIKKSEMDEVLKAYMGIGLTQTYGLGLDEFSYSAKFDSYYNLHGDTNYLMQINFLRGEREGNLIRLCYNDNFYCDGNKVLTLKDVGGTYLFVSHQMDESGRFSG
ncbi:MAG TPA: hypothetical protein PK629_06220 [Oscillospiraceae bacterium]|nr:hypothetical protein [Oscillospiraceae bacterium]HPF55593.1 hypothetical protein [Clostridiales bacterium]HPK35828.1 hypothetical protein [Oscillospiraceae bacterium]HPR76346.1 hypothetical protein [Oscillospiraceae bacterium]